MRFPLSLSLAAGFSIARNLLLRRRPFSMVLMLEPLHACNLRCSGCGRIREYADTLSQTMTVDECLEAARECGAPIVSICGGEPLLYRELPELIDRLLCAGKHLYLCTNGQILAESVPKLVNTVRNRRLKKRCYFNVHLDGPARLHDKIVEKPGAYERAASGIRAAKQAGFRVYTNTTVYAQTTVDDLIEMADALTAEHIDGLMISPGYEFRAVCEENPNALPAAGNENPFFMDRRRIEAFFTEVRARMGKYRLTATPVFAEFLAGERDLSCAAWANPTRNVRGWRSPCYLIGDRHFPTWKQWRDETDWPQIGPGRDVRCCDCRTHCGFEPASVLAVKTLPQILRITRWQFGGR